MDIVQIIVSLSIAPLLFVFNILRSNRVERLKRLGTLFTELRRTLTRETVNISPIGKGVGSLDAGAIIANLRGRDCQRFSSAFASYKEAKSATYQDEVGQPFYSSPDLIIFHIDFMLYVADKYVFPVGVFSYLSSVSILNNLLLIT